MKQENFTSEEVGKVEKEMDISVVVAMSIIIPMILFGNILTITAIFKFEHLRTKTNALVCSLSFGDIFVGVSLIPDIIYEILNKYDETSFKAIIIFGIIQTGYLVSVAHIACIASERYIFVMYPLKYHRMMTVKVIKLIICICWIIPILLGLTSVLIINALGVNYFMYFEVGAAVFYVLVGLIASFVYIRILLVAANQQKRIIAEQNTMDTGRPNINQSSQHNATLALGIIVMMYVLLWSPLCITTILRYFTPLPDNGAFEICSVIASILPPLNSAINCIIYTWKYSIFRKAYASLLKCQDDAV